MRQLKTFDEARILRETLIRRALIAIGFVTALKLAFLLTGGRP